MGAAHGTWLAAMWVVQIVRVEHVWGGGAGFLVYVLSARAGRPSPCCKQTEDMPPKVQIWMLQYRACGGVEVGFCPRARRVVSFTPLPL
jgi:hypothetical protein